MTNPNEKTEATCRWEESDGWGPTPGVWEGPCGVAWQLNEGTPAENDMNFCPKCGKSLELVPWVEPADEDEDND